MVIEVAKVEVFMPVEEEVVLEGNMKIPTSLGEMNFILNVTNVVFRVIRELTAPS